MFKNELINKSSKKFYCNSSIIKYITLDKQIKSQIWNVNSRSLQLLFNSNSIKTDMLCYLSNVIRKYAKYNNTII